MNNFKFEVVILFAISAFAQRDNNDCGGIIVPREEWDARPAKNITEIGDDLPYFFAHHTVTAFVTTDEECEEQMRYIQDLHMDDNGWDDIGYSFLICGNAKIYQGRGWKVEGAHTQGYNDKGNACSFMDDFTDHDPTEEMLQSFRNLTYCAVEYGYIAEDYLLYGHRQAGNTECPGNYFFDSALRTLEHWTEGCIEEDYDPEEMCGNV